MKVHIDAIGQDINPGDLVLSLRANTDTASKWVMVLKLTSTRITTTNGSFDPKMVVVVTELLKKQQPTQVAEAYTKYQAQVVNAPPAAPTMRTRFAVRLLRDGSSAYDPASHIIIDMITFASAIDYRRQMAVAVADTDNRGLKAAYLRIGRPRRAISDLNPQGWGYISHYGGASLLESSFTMKAIKEMKLDGLPNGVVMTADEFNNSIPDSASFIRYNQGTKF